MSIQRKPLPLGATVRLQSQHKSSTTLPPVCGTQGDLCLPAEDEKCLKSIASNAYDSQNLLRHEHNVKDVAHNAHTEGHRTAIKTCIPCPEADSIKLAHKEVPLSLGLVNSPIAMSPHAVFPTSVEHRDANRYFDKSLSPDDHLSQWEKPFPTTGSMATSTSYSTANAFQEASFFLGGLIKHPTESTKHFSILRHSHGLVYYKGPTTTVAITVLSDDSMPAERRYWLQMKGWTGKTGMATKALLRTNNNWINVTPDRRAITADLPPLDERAWQRDIKKFREKAPKSLQTHVPRETAILRVPYEAVDGYFRVVLTDGTNRRSLCPSPVFRVASTSLSASSLKGASLSTLPIELGVSILQLVAKQAAKTAVSPIARTAKQQVVGMLPSAIQGYGHTAYTMSGAQEELQSLDQLYNQRTQNAMNTSLIESAPVYTNARPDVVGDETGPQAPFPMSMEGKVVQGSGKNMDLVGIPTANINNIPVDKFVMLHGIYFGWALVTPKIPSQAHLHVDWRHAIISVSHHDADKAEIVVKKDVRAYLIHDYDGHDFSDSEISLLIMGYLRPFVPFRDRETYMTDTLRDMEVTIQSLSRDQWSPPETLRRVKTASSDRNFKDRYVDARTVVQRRVDSIPIHKLGIRTDSIGNTDRALHGNGGLYVVRDHR